VYAPEHPNRTKRGYVAEHRLVTSAHLGRSLLPGEVVHHKDGNRYNNAITNLQFFSANSEHLKDELTGRVPAWTAEGWGRILAGDRRSASRHRKARDGSERSQTNLPTIATDEPKAREAS